MAAMTEDRPTPVALERALAQLGREAQGEGALAEGDRLSAQLSGVFGADALRAGPDPVVEELTALWALEVPEALAAAGEQMGVRVLADDGTFSLTLRRFGRSAVFAGAATLRPGTAFRWNYEVAAGPHERRTLLPDIPNQRVTAPSGTTDLPAGRPAVAVAGLATLGGRRSRNVQRCKAGGGDVAHHWPALQLGGATMDRCRGCWPSSPSRPSQPPLSL